MTFNAMTEHYEEITVCGKPALFTSIRIKRDTIPDGLYVRTVHPFVLPPICSYCASIRSISCFTSCTSVSGAVTLILLP